MPSRTSRGALVLAAAGLLIALAACEPAETDAPPGAPAPSSGATDTGVRPGAQEPAEPEALVPTLAAPEDTWVVEGETSEARALEVSRALFESAPVVVLAAPDHELRAASAAAVLGVPVVVDGDGATEEIQRLGAGTALAVGPVEDPGIDLVVPGDDEDLARLLGLRDVVSVEADEVDQAVRLLSGVSPRSGELLRRGSQQAPDPEALPEADLDALPPTAPAEPQAGTVVMSAGDPQDLAAVGTARAAGARVVLAPDGDPRSTSESVQALAEADASAVVGLGEDFGDDSTLAWRARTAATGVELPGGGQLVLPDKTYVALYGTPSTAGLGVLGEQPAEETVARAEELAAEYEDLTDEPVVPTLEIIVSIASEGPGDDGNYSTELPVESLRPLVELAGERGLYVVLDLQPGRTDFLTQARRYQELLELPHVGLALDPEWRLRPDQVHLTEIGQVDAAEVDSVVTWLADLTRDNDLPQKVLVLHQFQARMIPGVNEVDRSRSEVAVLVHADGQGTQGDKKETWDNLQAAAPDIDLWGWKNFYDEDVPGPLTPEETMTLVEPTPDFISYQ